MTASPELTRDVEAYFDRLADVETRHWWALGMWRLAEHWLDATDRGRAGLRALDIGCGAGGVLARLAARRSVGFVVGIDPSPEALHRAKTRVTRPLVRGSALDLPIDDGAFDLVTCFDVLQHLPPGREARAAREIRRVLAPGGRALIRTNGRGWTGDDSTYRLVDLAGLVESTGLLIARASYANALPALVQELRGRFHRGGARSIPTHPSGGGLRIRVPPPTVNGMLRRVATAEAWLAGRAGLRLPFGHSTFVLAETPD
jgi:SAM-dependent methyltransferase